MARLIPVENRRRLVVLAGDLTILAAAGPAALWLTGSYSSAAGTGHIALWIASVFIGLAAVGLFRLHASLWRFASATDFLNIGFAALTIAAAIGLCIGLLVVAGLDVPPLRTAVVHGLIVFVAVGLSRVSYRFGSDALSGSREPARNGTSADAHCEFFGTIEDAALVGRQLRHNGSLPPLRAIHTFAPQQGAGYLANVPVAADGPAIVTRIKERRLATNGMSHAIVGRHGFPQAGMRAELINGLRKAGVRVLEFTGLAAVESEARADRMHGLTEPDVTSLINRQEMAIDEALLQQVIKGKRILITGGAGSIGSALAGRCLDLEASNVTVVDRWESGVFAWLRRLSLDERRRSAGHVADICDADAMRRIFREARPQIVFHAAAVKHVGLVEENWRSAIQVNIFGTLRVARLAAEMEVDRFVYVSSDKAVEPTTFLGWTKRFGELMCAAMNGVEGANKGTRFVPVRFGNVFGSVGSVIGVFEEQIKNGGPITITDPNMKRYFMTDREACNLLILSVALDVERPQSAACIYVLRMGEQVKITDIAEAMVVLAGRTPHTDIGFVTVGMRPHEKFEEKLIADAEPVVNDADTRVIAVGTPPVGIDAIAAAKTALASIAQSGAKEDAVTAIKRLEEPQPAESAVIHLDAERRSRAAD